MVEIVCRQCGKKVQARSPSRLYCSECLKKRRRMQNSAWWMNHREECRALKQRKALQQQLPEPDWQKSLDLFMRRVDLYNLSRKASGQPELSYGHYVARFDGLKENAAPSAGTPESGKD